MVELKGERLEREAGEELETIQLWTVIKIIIPASAALMIQIPHSVGNEILERFPELQKTGRPIFR